MKIVLRRVSKMKMICQCRKSIFETLIFILIRTSISVVGVNHRTVLVTREPHKRHQLFSSTLDGVMILFFFFFFFFAFFKKQKKMSPWRRPRYFLAFIPLQALWTEDSVTPLVCAAKYTIRSLQVRHHIC